MSIRSVEEVFMVLDTARKGAEAELAKTYTATDSGFLIGVKFAMKMLATVDRCDIEKLHNVVRGVEFAMLLIVPWTLLSAIQ